MTTKFIGVKEFRQNIAKITERSRKNNERLIVLRRNVPLFEVRPLSKKDMILEKLLLDIQEGLEDKEKGDVYSQDAVEKMLGL